MRSLGTLPNVEQAQKLADHLEDLGIEARVLPTGGQHAVWVCDEDKLPRAREEYNAFIQDPSASRFQSAARPRLREDEAPPPKSAPELHQETPEPSAEGPFARRPLTIGLIVACIAVTLLLHSPDSKKDVYHKLFITDINFGRGMIYWMPGLPELKQGEVWRAITPAFIHLSEAHLLFNMLALFYLGTIIEQRAGAWRLALLFLLFAVPSNLCQYWFSEVQFDGWRPIAVASRPNFGGASGVLFGLFGYIWMKAVYQRGSGYAVSGGNVVIMLLWLILCMTGLVGDIANTAHVVGLAAGMMTGYVSAWWYGFGTPEAEE